jgi:hypothetical protein
MTNNLTWIASATSGVIGGYDVLIAGDAVTVLRDGAIVTRQTAPGLGRFVGRARDLRLGWAMFRDFDVVYIYDKADHNFGYAVNLVVEHFSEWGYAPFAPTRETGS